MSEISGVRKNAKSKALFSVIGEIRNYITMKNATTSNPALLTTY
jgi:hypothetical protein